MERLVIGRETRFCPCGYSVHGTEMERRNAIARHRDSGEHDRMVKVNAVREAMARIDAIVEANLQEDR